MSKSVQTSSADEVTVGEVPLQKVRPPSVTCKVAKMHMTNEDTRSS